MSEEPVHDVERAASALFHELDRLAAGARGLNDEPRATGTERVETLPRELQRQRELSHELEAAVAVARDKASTLVRAARSLVTDVTIDRMERREWPAERNRSALPVTAADDASAGSRAPDPAGEHAALTRAVAFMTEHATERITVQDVAGASRVGVRHLQGLFRRHYGIAPMGHLRRVRLDGAHEDLTRADSTRGATVETIARRWRFVHLGRFASAYRARFGVVPSRTMRAVPPEH